MEDFNDFVLFVFVVVYGSFLVVVCVFDIFKLCISCWVVELEQ